MEKIKIFGFFFMVGLGSAYAQAITPAATSSSTTTSTDAASPGNPTEPVVPKTTPNPTRVQPPGPAGTANQNMQTIVVRSVDPEQSIMPTVRPISSVFGTDMNILDTPRAVSTITKGELDLRQIQDVDSLDQFASGTYSPSYFGAEGVPTIRGVNAETFQNGQRLTFYQNSLPPSFNQVEAVDVVKGPGSAIYGPASFGLGGYVNYVTKAPFFDTQHLEITTQIGDYTPSGLSYKDFQWTLDAGGPLIPGKLAYRFSYLGRESDSYYNYIKNNTEDFFAAVTWLPANNIVVNATAQYYTDRFNENAGFNRPTQELVNGNTYIGGPTTDAPPNGVPGFATGTVIPLNGVNYNANKGHIYAYDDLVAPSDSASGSHGVFQVNATATGDDITFVNTTLGETIVSKKYSDYGYDEYIPENINIDNRTEVHYDFDSPVGGSTSADSPSTSSDGRDYKNIVAPVKEDPFLNIQQSIIGGLNERYQDDVSYQDFNEEAFQQYDLLRPGGAIYYPRAAAFQGDEIPGMTNYSAGTFSNQDTTSDLLQLGIFLQDTIKFTPQLTLIAGARADVYYAAAGANPLDGPVADPTASGLPGSTRDWSSYVNGSYFGSFSYKPVKEVTTYVTYDRTTGINADQFGGLRYEYESDGHTTVAATDMKNLSELYEGGVKVSLLNDTLFMAVAGFYQTRVQDTQIGTSDNIDTRGVEFDGAYQPSKHLSLTANFTWEEANYHNSVPYSQTGNYLDTYQPVEVEEGRKGSGYGTPNFSSSPDSLPAGDYELSGLPKILFNAYAVYSFDCGLSFGMGPQVTGSQIADLQGQIVIPAQFTWNGFVQYSQKHWEVRLNVFNFTDERNFTAGSPSFTANDLVYPNEPITANMTIKYKF